MLGGWVSVGSHWGQPRIIQGLGAVGASRDCSTRVPLTFERAAASLGPKRDIWAAWISMPLEFVVSLVLSGSGDEAGGMPVNRWMSRTAALLLAQSGPEGFVHSGPVVGFTCPGSTGWRGTCWGRSWVYGRAFGFAFCPYCPAVRACAGPFPGPVSRRVLSWTA